MSENTLQVVASLHPLSREPVYASMRAGQTIAQALGEHVSHALSVSVGGHEVPRAMWAKVRPKAGQRVHVTAYLQGGDNSSKWIRIIALIVITYVTWGIGTAWGAGAYGVAGSAGWAAAFSVAATLALNALVPPPGPKGLGGGGGDPYQALNSLTGTSNQTNPYGVIPCVVGEKRYFPTHAALPYTEISGDDQYLRMLLDLGYGDLDISDIKIGETDIAAYDGVEWEISTNPSLFCQDIYELQVGVPLSATNDSAVRTTQAGTTEISLDLVFPQGLYGMDDKGKTTGGDTSFSIQYRAVGAPSWKRATTATGLTTSGNLRPVGNVFKTYSIAKKELRMGARWTVPPGQYEVSVVRGSTNWPNSNANAQVGDAAWTVLRSINPQLPSTTGTNKLAVRIKATDQLQGVVQNLSVLAAQRVRRWDDHYGQWLSPVSSTNPAWIYLWLMTQCPAIKRRLPDHRVDVVGIAAWAAECDAKGYKIGFVMDSGRALFDILQDVLAAGRASFGLRNGRYSAVRDLPQTVPVQMFTPDNSWGFSFTRSFIEPPHGLRVQFTNPEANDQQDTVTVYAPGYTEATATKFEELDLKMVTDPSAAWRLGMYHLAVVYYRPNQYSFHADIEHMVCERGDLVHVAHDVIGWGHAWGRVAAVDGATVTLDGPVTLEAGKDYAVRVRKDDGDQKTQTVITGAGDHQTLTLAGGIPDMAPGDLFVVGEINHGVASLIVRKIEPGDELTATITAVDADVRIWTADAATPPPFVSAITGKSWCAPPKPPVVHIYAADSAPDDAGVINAQLAIGNSGDKSGIYRFQPGGSGGGCVVVDSYLGSMQRAGDVSVGDSLQMADPDTLAPRQGPVSYSEAKVQPCVEIITESYVILRCSTTAPIPTERDGIVLAPHIAGKRIGVRDGNGTRWEAVRSVRSIGPRMVQHISVDDGCFWAGAEPGRCILHHNKLPTHNPPRRDNTHSNAPYISAR